MPDVRSESPPAGTIRGELSVDLPLRYVQALRLVHAIMESDYLVHLSEADADKFAHIRELFGLRYRVGRGAVVLPGVEISHDEPRTQIGSISRALIFPHGTFEHCRSLWPEHRPTRYLFAGHITARRHASLNRWVRRTLGGARLKLPRNDGWRQSLRRKLERLVGRRRTPATYKAEFGELVLWASESGRHFPTKIWDRDYYEQMAKAQFVLCPDGECVWTYRFYESVMCGAMPIVENPCPAYEGFQYATMADDPVQLEWSEAVAQANYERAKERLTISRDVLNREIGSLLATLPRAASPGGTNPSNTPK